MGGTRKLFGFHLKVIQSIQSIRRILLTPHRHILVIGKASQGKQFNSRIAALCAGFEEHVLALNSNIDGVVKESHVIDAFQRVWTKAVVNSCKVCLIINYKSCSKLMRPVQTLIWKITNVLATGKHDFEIFSGDEAKTLLGWDKNSKDSGKLQTVLTQKIREYLKIIVTSTPRYLKTSELISNYGNIKRLFDNIFIKPWSKHTFQGLGKALRFFVPQIKIQ